MNAVVDLVILIILAAHGVMGYYWGFLRGFASLFGLVLTLAAAWTLHRPIAPFLTDFVSPPVAPAAAFLLLIALFYLISSLLLRETYKGMPPEVHKSPFNRVMGVIPGLLDGVIMVALLVTILTTLPIERIPRDAINDSTIGSALLEAGGTVQARALEVFGEAMQTFVPLRTVRPDSKERVKLPFHTDRGQPDAEIEREMWEMVNRERTSRGLKALKWDPRLVPVGRKHSLDMLKRGYFAHLSPEEHGVGHRLKEAGLQFEIAGENLALAPTLLIAHTGLMNSPDHRKNILSRDFTHIGIGAVVARPYGIMITQVFAKE
jgi:uncharacterized protein YkwD